MDTKYLKQTYINAQITNKSFQESIDWAITQIDNGVDNNNINILAGLDPYNSSEVREYIGYIIGEEVKISLEEYNESAARIIIHLKDKLNIGHIDIIKMDEIISTIYNNLNYPNWLSMLARNCEYATDIKSFEVPFYKELEYICDLWINNPSYTQFICKYDRNLSNKNDL